MATSKKRRPRTLTETKFSVRARQRVRYALASYRYRKGYSYQKLFDEIDRVLGYTGEFKDRQQVQEFLKGSEPTDEKIRASISFLEASDETFSGAVEDDGFDVLLGNVFSQLMSPILTDKEMSDMGEKLEKFCGVYERRELFASSTMTTNIGVLNISRNANSHFLSASMLATDWRSYPGTVSKTDQLLAGLTPSMITETVVDCGSPIYIGQEEAYRLFAKFLMGSDVSSGDLNPIYKISSGFIFARDDQYFFMLQRSILSLEIQFFVGRFESTRRIEISTLEMANVFNSAWKGTAISQHPQATFERLDIDVQAFLKSNIAEYQD